MESYDMPRKGKPRETGSEISVCLVLGSWRGGGGGGGGVVESDCKWG